MTAETISPASISSSARAIILGILQTKDDSEGRLTELARMGHDLIEELGDEKALALWQSSSLESGCDRWMGRIFALLRLVGKWGRKSADRWLESQIKEVAGIVYAARMERRTHPEGEFDKKGRWYPSEAEDADGFTGGIRSPSARWPYAYMLAARTKKHCVALVSCFLLGMPVPSEIEQAAAGLKAVFEHNLRSI